MEQFKKAIEDFNNCIKELDNDNVYINELKINYQSLYHNNIDSDITNYSNILTSLSGLLIDKKYTELIIENFRPLLLELIIRSLKISFEDDTYRRIITLGTMFTQVLPSFPQALPLFKEFLIECPCLLDKYSYMDLENLESYLSDEFLLEDIKQNIRLLLRLLFCFNNLGNYWNFDMLFYFLDVKEIDIASLSLRCLQITSNLTEKDVINLVSADTYLNSQKILLVESDLYQKSRNVKPITTFWNLEPFSNSLSPSIVNVGNVLLLKASSDIVENKRLIPTKTTLKNLEEISLALSIGAPVLLEGETGVGKTELIEEMARITGKKGLVKIHLGDQTDSKALLGTYVTTSTPGQFRWQIGVLTRAVKYGLWVLIEDIDLAPQEVISVIIPLLESRTLFISNRGERLVAAEGFQLFATRRISTTNSKIITYNHLPGGSFWTKVNVAPLSTLELSEVISKRFPLLTIISGDIIGVYSTMKKVYDHPEEFNISSVKIGRPITTRDLIKWCTRMSSMLISSKQSIVLPLSERLKEDFFSEAVDCYTSMIADFDIWCKVLEVLGNCLGLPNQRVTHYIKSYVPQISSDNGSQFCVGRVSLIKYPTSGDPNLSMGKKKQPFSLTKHALRLLEKLSVCIHMIEPVLLVGETGTGKTTVVQHLANEMNQKLLVVNLSQQSDSSDLLGGFKPVDGKAIAMPIYETFEDLFSATFSASSNAKFLNVAQKFFNKKKWTKLIQIFNNSIQEARKLIGPHKGDGSPAKSARTISPRIAQKWIKFEATVNEFASQVDKIDNKLLFSFIEGSLVKAIRRGHWVLLDEINLASTETLECLSGLLQDSKGSIVLTERGDSEAIERHPNFRVFACMNPATDVGKRDLPPGLRNRFTEFYVHSPDTNQEDLTSIVKSYLHGLTYGDESAVLDVVNFYQEAKTLQHQRKIADGANQIPHYSIRTLSRSLTYVSHIIKIYGLRRSLFEGFSMTFSTQLNREGEKMIIDLINKHLLRTVKNIPQLLSHIPKLTTGLSEDEFVRYGAFWLPKGPEPIDPKAGDHYIITPSVKNNLSNLARVVMSSKYPVLIQGPTSSGKTSMIEYLAKCTGHRFIRINNHEHTDLQEYIGSYISKDGKLVFEEGALVKALRNGHWIVLDELNLAPSDVLEALNRLLDDNRELLISETQEVVKPHPHFMLFATQNPAGLYGGRKALSRAFRNRFLELHFDDIPESELESILGQRCVIAPSYCKKLIEVYKKLQERRLATRVFESKEGYITLRDLFRWANRHAVGYDQLAADGYMLLAERVRKPEEKVVVKEVIEEVMKVKIKEEEIYNVDNLEEYKAYQSLNLNDSSIAWTKAMKRLFSLVTYCLRNNEPVLLVGETGCGKTTVCQMLAKAMNQKLNILNCHQNTETSDLLGGQRPLRNKNAFCELLKVDLFDLISNYNLVNDFNLNDFNLEQLINLFKKLYGNKQSDSKLWSLVHEGILNIETLNSLLERCHQSSNLFEWHDGPLVQSMKEGHLFLLDEISLAEDSVLERLNSVLEPQRLLVLAEKGSEQVEELYADEKFKFLATMNPGGDFGKKELSPALRNRFTEIWVPSVTDEEDLLNIIERNLSNFNNQESKDIAKCMLSFFDWYAKEVTPASITATQMAFSLRDILSWAGFMDSICSNLGDSKLAFIHGGCLVVLDGLGSNSSMISTHSEDPKVIQNLRSKCLRKLMDLCQYSREDSYSFYRSQEVDLDFLLNYYRGLIIDDHEVFGIDRFKVQKGNGDKKPIEFSWDAPTTFDNMRRVLRALQINKPIMLEGSPGVGKTSLIQALSDLCCFPLVRINLSEQTDLMDLFGTDLPVEGGKSGEFAWRDAPFLQAMRSGWWVLLDEINLASQSVLEGLNSCLDHRGSVFIPELDRTFDKAPTFRVFAAQNPLQQGGGRKGLPKSFVNRFTQVYVEALQSDDLQLICQTAFPAIDKALISKMLTFNFRLHYETMVRCSFGRAGSPWEFNLRDVFRWLELIVKYQLDNKIDNVDPSIFLELIYLVRMRNEEDRDKVKALYSSIFTNYDNNKLNDNPNYYLNEHQLQIGYSKLLRVESNSYTQSNGPQLLHSQLKVLESVMKSIEMNWLSILIGSQGCGKTSCIRYLASVTRNKLVEFSMNSGVDTMELLGGFEQMESSRYRTQLKDSIIEVIRLVKREIIAKCNLIHIHGGDKRQIYKGLKGVMAWERKILKAEWDTMKLDNISTFMENIKPSLTRILREVQINLNIEQLFEKSNYANQAIRNIEIQNVGGRFEWIEGVLIEAMKQGHWLLIDNANLCHASVLDRLNPLFEPKGSLILHERGLDEDGKIRLVKPHPSFRVFLAMDPNFGELSRPMRNRGLEITFTKEHDWSTNLNDVNIVTDTLGPFYQDQMKQLVNYHHIILSQNKYLENAQWVPGYPRDLSFLLQWVNERLRRGQPFELSIKDALMTVYKVDKFQLNYQPLEFHKLLFNTSPKDLLLRDSYLYNLLDQMAGFNFFLTNVQNEKWSYSTICSGLYFIERATTKDVYLREIMLDWIASQTCEANLKYIQMLKFVLKKLKECYFIEHLDGFYSKLLEAYPVIGSYSTSPLDLVNTGQFLDLSSQANEDYDDSYSIIKQYINFIDKYRVQIEYSQFQYLEYYALQNFEYNIINLNLLEQSVRFFKFNEKPEGPYSDLISALYPIILEIRQIIESWLFDEETTILLSNQDISQLIRLLITFFKAVEQNQIEFGKLKIILASIYKLVVREQNDLAENLKQSINKIIDNIGKHTHRGLKYIWKSYKYPILNHSAVFELYTKWYTKFKAVLPTIQSWNSELIKIQMDIVNGLASLFILDYNDQGLSETLNSIQQLLSEAYHQLEICQEKKKNKDEQLDSKAILIRDHFNKFFCYEALFNEDLLLNQLNKYPLIVEKHDSLIQNMNELIKFSLTNALYLSLDFVALQNLIWSIEKHNMTTYKTESHDLNGFLLDLSIVHNTHLWKNEINQYQHNQEMRYGPTILYQSTKTLTIIQMISSVNNFPLNEFKNTNQGLSKVRQISFDGLKDSYPNIIQSLKSWFDQLKIWILSFDKFLDPEQIDLAFNAVKSISNRLNQISNSLFLKSKASWSKLIRLNLCLNEIEIIKEAFINSSFITLSEVGVTYLEPALSHIQAMLPKLREVGCPSLYLDLGKAWLLLGLGFNQLFITPYPYDPVVKARIKYEMLDNKAIQLDQMLLALKAIQWNYNSNQTNLDIIEKERCYNDLLNELKKIKDELILRPEGHELASLFHELNYVRNELGERSSVLELVKLIEEDLSETTQSRELLLQSNLDEFIKRLNLKFNMFKDLFKPVEQAIYHIKNGIRLVVFSSQLKKNSTGEHPILELVIKELVDYLGPIGNQSSTIIKPIMQNEVLSRVKHIFTNNPTPSKIKIYSNVLLMVTRHFTSDLQRHGYMDLHAYDRFESLFFEIAQVISQVEEQRRKAAAEKETLFKTRTKIEDNFDLDEEKELELERQKLFPTFESAFEEQEESWSILEDTQTYESLDDSWIMDVVAMYRTATNSPQDFIALQPLNKAMEEDTLKLSYKLAKDLVDLLQDTTSPDLDLKLKPSLAMIASLTLKEIHLAYSSSTLKTTTGMDIPYNFYHHSNLGEAKLVVPLLTNLTEKINGLLEEFNEHAVLLDLLKAINYLLILPAHVSLMKLLTGLDILLTKAQDWEKYAHKNISLAEYLNPIISLIIRWRQLELGSWPTLLDSIRLEFKTTAWGWWSYLFSTILGTNLESLEDGAKDNYLESMTEAIDSFLRSSNLGEFEYRVDLVGSILEHLRLKIKFKEENSIINQIVIRVSNLHLFYSQFLNPARSKVASLRKPIDKELKGLVKIASWKDVNLDALKQSAQKTHRALSKLTRKFRIGLIEPISITFENIVASVTNPEIKFEFSKSDKGATLKHLQPEHSLITIEHWDRSEDASLFSKIQRFFQNEIHPFLDIQNHPSVGLESFMNEVLEQISEFRNEKAPSEEDELKTYVKTSKMIRRHSLNGFWKELKFLGLKFRSSVKRSQAGNHLFQQDHIQQFHDAWRYGQNFLDPKYSELYGNSLDWQKASFYTLRFYARINHLRNACLQPQSHDATLLDLEKGLGYTNHLFKVLEYQRGFIKDQLPSLLKLQAGLVSLEGVVEDGISLEANAHTILEADKWFLDHLKITFQRIINIIENSDKPDDEVLLLTKLNNLMIKCDELHLATNSNYSKFVVYPNSYGLPSILNNQCKGNIYRNQKGLNVIYNDLLKINNEYSSKSSLFVPIIESISEHLVRYEQEINISQLKDSEYISKQMGMIGNKANSLIESIQLATQKIIKLNRNTKESQTDVEIDRFGLKVDHLMNDKVYQANLFTALNMNLIVQLLNDIMVSINQFIKVKLINIQQIEIEIRSHLNRIYPFIKHYFLSSRYLIFQYLAMHKSTSKLGFIVCNLAITLVTQGFCLPEIEEGEGEGQGIEGATGTGIGEGEGDKDVGEEIEDESQVTGTKNEEKSNHEQSEKDKEKAFEMEEDFDGEMEDVDQSSQDGEEEEESDSDDEDEVEDQLGQLDGEDDAIDEKIWEDDEAIPENDGPKKDTNDQGKEEPGEEDIVAKDEGDEGKEDERDNRNEENQPNEQNGDESNDGDEMDEKFEEQENEPHHDKESTKPIDLPEGDNLELPEDLELDMDDDGDEKGSDEEFKSEMDDDEINLEDIDEADHLEAEEEENEDETSDKNEIDRLEIQDEPEENQGQEEENENKHDSDNEREIQQPDSQDQDNMEGMDDKLEDPAELEKQAPKSNEKQQEPPTQSLGVVGEQGDVNLEDDGNPMDKQQSKANASKNEAQPEENKDLDPINASENMEVGGDNEDDGDKMMEEADPRRVLADVVNKWKQRLEIHDRKEDEKLSEDNEVKENNEPLPLDENAKQDFEFAQENEDFEGEAMGTANEEQFKMSIPIPEESKEEEDQDNKEGKKEKLDPVQEAVQGKPSDEAQDEEALGPSNIFNTDFQPWEASLNSTDITGKVQEVEELRQELENQLVIRNNPEEIVQLSQSIELWKEYTQITHELSLSLTEQLRLILEPTQATKLKGDYRTGKRLSMKKIIPYIASQFKKDKIWMRRTKPSKRQYKVMLAVDDSKSMNSQETIKITFEALTLVVTALNRLEVGSIGVVSFGEKVSLLHPFELPLTSQTGGELLSKFTFNQTKTDLNNLLLTSINLFESSLHSSSSNAELWQLQFILSDGICEDHDALKHTLRKAEEQRIMVIFLILDTKPDPKSSILKIQNVNYVTNEDGQFALSINRYLDTFPFRFYTILKRSQDLPIVLADALRQYFMGVAE